MQRGRDVISRREYSRTGDLTIFREENTHVAAESSIDRHESLAAAYVATKASALRERDGLFEVWFPPGTN
jgi:hypothetical protein